jgi:hypothetical protein
MRLRESEVVVGRRYLGRGFIDAAMHLFARNAALVRAADWNTLVDRLMDRRRIADVVRVCELAGIPLPSERLLELGDTALARRDVESAKSFYEIAGADTGRWSRLLDVLIGVPEYRQLALAIADRHLAQGRAEPGPAEVAAAS